MRSLSLAYLRSYFGSRHLGRGVDCHLKEDVDFVRLIHDYEVAVEVDHYAWSQAFLLKILLEDLVGLAVLPDDVDFALRALIIIQIELDELVNKVQVLPLVLKGATSSGAGKLFCKAIANLLQHFRFEWLGLALLDLGLLLGRLVCEVSVQWVVQRVQEDNVAVRRGEWVVLEGLEHPHVVQVIHLNDERFLVFHLVLVGLLVLKALGSASILVFYLLFLWIDNTL